MANSVTKGQNQCAKTKDWFNDGLGLNTSRWSNVYDAEPALYQHSVGTSLIGGSVFTNLRPDIYISRPAGRH